MSWQCFMLDMTGHARRSLRRYVTSGVSCAAHPGAWGHDAEVLIEDGPLTLDTQGYFTPLQNVTHDDPRWPRQCPCGYVFTDDDVWQVNEEALYRAPDGALYTLRYGKPDCAPAGAMWDAQWQHDWMTGPDGLSLNVMLPDGTPWFIDGPSRSDERPWSRTGTPPAITARPSIASPRYHGWLTDGVLSDDLEGRSY